MSSPRVILIAGQKRSGKDTFGKLLAESLEADGSTVSTLAFAAPMKQLLAVTLGISLEQLDTYKNSPMEYLLVHTDRVPHSREYTANYRSMLQRLGTEAAKPIFGDNVWAELAAKQVAEATTDYVIITDFRFPAEATAFNSPLAIRITRPGLRTDTHSSETALADYSFDAVIDNSSTLAALTSKAKHTAEYFQ